MTAYFEHVAVGASTAGTIVVNPQSWWSGLTTVLDDLRQLQQHVGSLIQVRAHEVQQPAGVADRAACWPWSLLCFAGSVLPRRRWRRCSITRPLAELAAEADSVAASGCRPPCAGRRPARTTRPTAAAGAGAGPRDVEIRPVATALDRHAVRRLRARDRAGAAAPAHDRVADQPRPPQPEPDPPPARLHHHAGARGDRPGRALANLFELDHLATRMRRNAASLLVLVGATARGSGPRRCRCRT